MWRAKERKCWSQLVPQWQHRVGVLVARGGVTMKKNVQVTGQLPPPSITINGLTHTPPSINALAGSEVM